MNKKTSSRANNLKEHLNGPAFVAEKCLPACRKCFQRLKLTRIPASYNWILVTKLNYGQPDSFFVQPRFNGFNECHKMGRKSPNK